MASDNDHGRRFFTTSEVATYCAVTNDGVLKWIKSGKLRAFSTPGGHYRVSAEDFSNATFPWLTGRDFTAADIEVGLPLYRYFTCGLDHLRDLPRLAAYYTRLAERPAYAEHVMVNYDVLKTHKP